MKQPIFSAQTGRIQSIIAFLSVLSLMLISQPAQAAVELVYFRGNVSNEQFEVEITWKTSYEQRTAEYFITRKIKDSADEPQIISVILDDQSVQRIPAAQNGITGGEYTVADPNIVEGATYEYSLWEREFNNSEPSEPEESFEILAAPQQQSSDIAKPTATLIPTVTPTTQSDGQSGTSTPTADSGIPATSTPIGDGATPDPTQATATPPVETQEADNNDEEENQADTSGSAQPTTTPIATTDPNSQSSDPTLPPEPTEVPIQSEPEPATSPTVSIVQEEPETTQQNDGVAEAGELPQEDTYPEPEGENGENYVPPEPTPTPMPIDTNDVQQIGSGTDSDSADSDSGQNNLVNAQAVQQATPEEISRSRFILWGGFISSLVLFFAVVVATLFMYRQRNSGG